MRYLVALMVVLLGLRVEFAAEAKSADTITAGGLTLERSYVYLFEPVTLPKWDWTVNVPYQTNHPSLAKLYIDTSREGQHACREEKTINALQVDQSGMLWLGTWLPKESGEYHFDDIFILYAPRLWKIDFETVTEAEMLQYTRDSWWNIAFKNETKQHIYSGLEAFTLQEEDGKTAVYLQRSAYSFDKSLKGGRFYLVIRQKWIEDLNIIGKVKMNLPQRGVVPLSHEALETLAESGDVAVQCEVGERYLYGTSVDQSVEKASFWLQRAAAQGYAQAFYNLGEIYFNNIDYGVEKDREKAMAYFLEAAKLGGAQAQLTLGKAYLKGEGALQSETEGLKWLFAAAAQEEAHAQLELARYYKRQGNDAEAEKWLKRAEDNGLRVSHPFSIF
jgi:tetratricopeptide (TPR) repeat protein